MSEEETVAVVTIREVEEALRSLLEQLEKNVPRRASARQKRWKEHIERTREVEQAVLRRDKKLHVWVRRYRVASFQSSAFLGTFTRKTHPSNVEFRACARLLENYVIQLLEEEEKK